MNILLVEDQDDQVLLVETALEFAGVHVQLSRADSGEACLARLREDGPPPDLVLLDLNMPRMSGFDVLAERSRDGRLRGIPMVVLTSSSNPADVRKAHDLGCDGYVAKPIDLYRLGDALRHVVEQWSQPSQPPTAA
ncbi:response regulator [Ramlibacter sp. WS9]|uniref:response regulator n=1 Tax=Ramlibacter sp. WS9 TaxID=1882741 RepID=UPI00114408D2|nr:response regulator [Ramlibacter sp. WS9]ROZ62734.1 response regulator [Ramlibacter sp. WS9]